MNHFFAVDTSVDLRERGLGVRVERVVLMHALVLIEVARVAEALAVVLLAEHLVFDAGADVVGQAKQAVEGSGCQCKDALADAFGELSGPESLSSDAVSRNDVRRFNAGLDLFRETDDALLEPTLDRQWSVQILVSQLGSTNIFQSKVKRS